MGPFCHFNVRPILHQLGPSETGLRSTLAYNQQIDCSLSLSVSFGQDMSSMPMAGHIEIQKHPLLVISKSRNIIYHGFF